MAVAVLDLTARPERSVTILSPYVMDEPGGYVRRWLKRGALPKTMTQALAESLLKANGWTRTQGGKHNVKMEKKGCRPITLPMCNGGAYSVDLTRRILKEAGLR